MKLHYHPVSTYSQKALIAVHEKDAQVDKQVVDLFDAQARAAYRAFYPFGKLPLLELAHGQLLPESTVIIEYLDDYYAEQSTRLLPKPAEAARRVRLRDRMNDLYLLNPAAALFFALRKPKEQQDQQAIANAQQTLDIVYQSLNKHVENGCWIAGDGFSLADCSAIPGLLVGSQVYSFAEQYPALQQYFKRALERPSVKAVMAEARAAYANMHSE